jgi:hypothetical protein
MESTPAAAETHEMSHGGPVARLRLLTRGFGDVQMAGGAITASWRVRWAIRMVTIIRLIHQEVVTAA